MKQPFTIGGTAALKKALLEETRIRVYDEDTCTEWDYLICDTDFCGLQGCVDQLSTHYQLPQDWDKAVTAVKDFFAEEKFEKGKWYYGINRNTEDLFKFSHVGCDGAKIFSETIQLGDKKRVYYLLNQVISDTGYLKPATTEQIQLMLGKVAEQKGYKPNAVIKNDNNIEYTLVEGYTPGYFPLSDSFNYCGYRVYWDGKWAELLPQEEAKPQTLVLKDVLLVDKLGLKFRNDLHLTATHLQQLKAYFNS
jgi:hypothetical protein